jgi:aldehyde dehydrogenase (NAD+)
MGKFMNAGQTCIAPDTVYCHEDVREEFLDILKGVIRRFYGADPKKSLISEGL